MARFRRAVRESRVFFFVLVGGIFLFWIYFGLEFFGVFRYVGV